MSKSKQNRKKSPAKKSPPPTPVAAQAPTSSKDEEIFRVPKKTSKLKFFFIVGLMIFVLVIFTVGDQIGSSTRRGPGDSKIWMRWNNPTEGVQEYTPREFILAKQQVDRFTGALGGQGSEIDDDQIFQLMIFDSLAGSAGVMATDEDLRTTILSITNQFRGQNTQVSTEDVYRFILQRARMVPNEFEEILRRQLRIGRYQTLLSQAVGLPEPARMEEIWKKDHEEFAFDYIVLKTEALVDDPLAAIPAEEDLRAWYEGLEERVRLRKFPDDQEPRKASAEMVGYLIGGVEPTGLLARFPRPEGTDLDLLAQQYWNACAHSRFPLPEPTEPLVDSGEAPGLYTPFEEVAEEARREAPIWKALEEWHLDLVDRLGAGEEIDLAAEAEELGLAYIPVDTLRSKEEWRDLEDWGGVRIATNLLGTDPGKITKTLTVESGGMVVGRVEERIEIRSAPFEKVADKAGATWQEDELRSLVVTHLDALRDTLEPLTQEQFEGGYVPSADAEAFRLAAEAAGYEVLHRDWSDRQSLYESMSDEDDSDAGIFMRSYDLFQLEEGQVASAKLGTGEQDDRAYLVRMAGRRDPAEVTISPQELENLRNRASQETASEFLERLGSRPYWEEHFGFWIEAPEEEELPAEG